MVERRCEYCSEKFLVHKYRGDTARFCSGSCRSKNHGVERLENVKPIVWSQYWFLKRPNHHRANKQGYVKMADLVAETKIGRMLFPTEIVHHIDGDKLNDHPDNLEVMDKIEHDIHHTNERWKKWDRWARKYDKCVRCGTNEKKHFSRGMCRACYNKWYRYEKS